MSQLLSYVRLLQYFHIGKFVSPANLQEFSETSFMEDIQFMGGLFCHLPCFTCIRNNWDKHGVLEFGLGLYNMLTRMNRGSFSELASDVQESLVGDVNVSTSSTCSWFM